MREKTKAQADYWSNIREDGSVETWPSKELAEKNLTRGVVACVRVEREIMRGDKKDAGGARHIVG